jgi:predicted DNA-binding transcriptional regulator AlpA
MVHPAQTTSIPHEQVGEVPPVASIPALMDIRGISELLGLKVETLRLWVEEKRGPTPRLMGKRLRWAGRDVALWLESLPVRP